MQNYTHPVGRFFKALDLGFQKHPMYSLLIEPLILLAVIELASHPIKAAVEFVGGFLGGNAVIIHSGYEELHAHELHQELSRNGTLGRRGTNIEI